MLKKTVIALAALGFVGAASLAPTTPAEAFFLCAKDSKHAKSERCVKRAKRRAESKARWDAFWKSLLHRDRKRG